MEKTIGQTPDIGGLTEAQVRERMAEGLSNHADITTGRTYAQIIRANILTYFNLIFLILSALLCAAGSYRNLTFLPVILGNIIIGIVQEFRAKRTLDKMKMLHAPHSIVVREHKQTRISSEELVKDDVVLLASGRSEEHTSELHSH